MRFAVDDPNEQARQESRRDELATRLSGAVLAYHDLQAGRAAA